MDPLGDNPDKRSLQVSFSDLVDIDASSDDSDAQPDTETRLDSQTITVSRMDVSGDTTTLVGEADTNVRTIIDAYKASYFDETGDQCVDPIVTFAIFENPKDIYHPSKFYVTPDDVDMKRQPHLFIIITTDTLVADVRSRLAAGPSHIKQTILFVLGGKLNTPPGNWLVDLQKLIGEWLFTE